MKVCSKNTSAEYVGGYPFPGYRTRQNHDLEWQKKNLQRKLFEVKSDFLGFFPITMNCIRSSKK